MRWESDGLHVAARLESDQLVLDAVICSFEERSIPPGLRGLIKASELVAGAEGLL